MNTNTNRQQQIVPCSQHNHTNQQSHQLQQSVLPQLEIQSPLSRQKNSNHNNSRYRVAQQRNDRNVSRRKRTYSNVSETVHLSQGSCHEEIEKHNNDNMEPPNKRQKDT